MRLEVIVVGSVGLLCAAAVWRAARCVGAAAHQSVWLSSMGLEYVGNAQLNLAAGLLLLLILVTATLAAAAMLTAKSRERTLIIGGAVIGLFGIACAEVAASKLHIGVSAARDCELVIDPSCPHSAESLLSALPPACATASIAHDIRSGMWLVRIPPQLVGQVEAARAALESHGITTWTWDELPRPAMNGTPD